MAEYDELTGLFSLKGYGNAVHQRLNQDSGASYVLIFLDISAFRDYNHKYGFQEGDNLLLCF
ncbi:MAG: GGDEF domain-containing protein, partial [Eubacterium sp.]|nr:GGDEF domain-containing protein [Eubacterium sp.]